MTKCNRIAVVFNNDQRRFELAKSLAASLKDCGSFSDILVYTRHSIQDQDEELTCKVIPSSCDTLAKARNYVNQEIKNSGFNGILHVIEDSVVIKDGLDSFLDAIEQAMDVLDYSVWFNTICDPCNYVYSKLNPRVSVLLDSDRIASLGLKFKKILFTSHSNTAWIAYDFSKVEDDLLKFYEEFNIPMFMIIEFLARRRNSRKADQLYRMNMYMSIDDEVGKFEMANNIDSPDPKEMDRENVIFKSLDIGFSPDNNVNELLEVLWAKLLEKTKTTSVE